MFGKFSATMTLVGLAVLGSTLAVPSAGAQSTVTQITPRPEFTLATNDVPPGFEETNPVFMRVGDVAIDDRLLRRSGGRVGPGWIWSASYERITTPTEENVARAGEEIAAILSRRLGSSAVLGDWEGIETHEPGEHVVLYSFTYQRLESGSVSNGALIVFSRGNVVSAVAVIGDDTSLAADAVRLARIVDTRTQRNLSASSR